MTWLVRLNSLRARITASQAALVAGLIAIAATGIAALQRVREAVTRELSVNAQIAEASSKTVAGLFDQMRAAERFYSDNAPEVQSEFRTASALAHEGQQQLLSLGNLPQEDVLRIIRIGTLHGLTESWYAYSHALIDLQRVADAADAAITAREYASQLITLIREFSLEHAESSAATSQLLVAATREREQRMYLVLIASVVVGSTIVFATLRSVNLPLVKLANVARRYSQGDLRAVVLGDMPHEVEQVATALNAIGTKLRTVVREVMEQSERILAAAADLSAMSEQLAASGGMISTAMVEISEGAREQVRSLDLGQKATDGLRGAATTNLEVARRVAEVGGRIRNLAQRHGEDVTAAGDALLNLGEVVQVSAAQVEELDKLSESIDEFVDMIKQVSSQTNLLALNAAIEAARARSGGQGFAVVADEVRQLADTSGDAAGSAAKSISVVRKQVAEVMETMALGRNRVRGVESVAHGAAQALDEIVKVVTEVEGAAQSVIDSARLNLDAAVDIKRLMSDVAKEAEAHAGSSEQVSAAAQEQGASTEQIAAQSTELNVAAERLKAIIQGLRV